jgi:hypothetical protein
VVAIRSREPPDVEELPDPGLVGQVTHRARQETALRAGDMGDVGKPFAVPPTAYQLPGNQSRHRRPASVSAALAWELRRPGENPR